MVESIGKYRILGLIGRGAAGAVYKAHDPLLKRVVAIRIISDDVDATEGLRARFFKEAQASARLNHPNIVTLYDLGEERGRLFVVMEYVDGEELSDVIAQRRALTLEAKLSLVAQVCDGLAFAHDRGIVHRDVRPGNIFLSNGQAKILGFGVAQLAAAAGSRTALTARVLRYMSPEQTRGLADQRSDIFSLGAVCYELVAYHPACPGDDPMVLLEELESGRSPSLFRPDPVIPDDLGAVIERALRKSPDERFANLAELRAALDGARTRLVDVARAAGTRPEAAEQTLEVRFPEPEEAPTVAEPPVAVSARLPAVEATLISPARVLHPEPERTAAFSATPTGSAAISVAPSAIPAGPAATPAASLVIPTTSAAIHAGSAAMPAGSVALPDVSGATPTGSAAMSGPSAAIGATSAAAADAAGRSRPARLHTAGIRWLAVAGMGLLAGGLAFYWVLLPLFDSRSARTEVAAAQQRADAARDRAVKANAPLEAKRFFDEAAAREGEAKQLASGSRFAAAVAGLHDAADRYRQAEEAAVVSREMQQRADQARTQMRAARQASDPRGAGFDQALEHQQDGEGRYRERAFEEAAAKFATAGELFGKAAARPPSPPEPSPPTAPVRDASAEIREVLRLYAKVFEAKDLDLLRQLRPRIRADEVARHRDTFEHTKSYRVNLKVEGIQVTGNDAVVRGRREDVAVTSYGETFRTPGQFTFRLKRVGERWTIDAVK